MGDQPSRVTVIRIRAPGVDVPALAEGLRLWYENQNLETSTAVTPTGLMVQCRRLQTSKRASSTDPPLAVMLRSEGEDLRVEIGSAKWLNKVTAVTILGILPAKAVMTTTRLLFELGTWRWWYYRLSNQTINFLRATAPMHVRSR
jgi:hypothetical protein